MTIQNDIVNEYFEWLFGITCEDRFSPVTSYRKLLTHLHEIPFRYSIQKDRNRADDGVNLRYRFAISQGYKSSVEWVLDTLDEPCSVLEMMTALAVRIEEDYMDDPELGDRTKQWFWGMIVNLGLGGMTDDLYDSRLVDFSIDRFLNREYESNGRGGLFTIRNCEGDTRNVEIWHQLCWYLNTLM